MPVVKTSIAGVEKNIAGTLSPRDEVAVAYNTVPRYVRYTASGVDLLTEWVDRDVRDGNLDFREFFGHVSAVFPDVAELEILKQWIARNPHLSEGALVFYAQMSVADLLDVETFAKYDAPDFVLGIEREARAVALRLAKDTTQVAALDQGIPHTEFVPTKKVFLATFPERVPLDVVFDNYIPSVAIPFATYGGMYKYSNGHDAEYASSSTSEIVFKGRDGAVAAQASNTRATTEIQFYVGVGEDADTVFKEVYGSLHMDAGDDVTLEQTSVQGVFYFLGYATEKYTFADFVMNNPVVSAVFSLGEFGPLSKKSSATRIYMASPPVTASYSVKTADSSTADSKYISDMVSTGDQYIRVFVARASSDADVRKFIDMLSRVMYLYIKEYSSIDKLYRSYIPTFPSKIHLFKQVTTPAGTQLDPRIFLPNYSRTCPHIPTPVVEGETAEHMLEFPNKSGLFYTCTDAQYKYPGVRENTLANSDEFPYVPCCFKTDQTTRPNYIKYYSDAAQSKYIQIRMITTLKPLASNFFGALPENIRNMLSSLRTDRSYVRYGVSTTKSSLLDCLNHVFGKKVGRQKLAARINVALCLQENPGVSLQQLRDSLADADAYLDPKRYVRLLEHIFNTDIYLFRDDELVLPNYTEGYYAYKSPARKCVMIYEQTDVQQCELISEWNVDNGAYRHVHADLSTDLAAALQQMYSFWAGGVKVVPIVKPEYFSKCVAQYVDMYGKTRGVVVELTGGNVFVETSPVPPLNVPLAPKTENTKELETAFVAAYGAYVGAWTGGVFTALPTTSTPVLSVVKTNQRIARYVTNVFLYMYSAWAHATGDGDIARFVDEKCAVDPLVQYAVTSPSTDRIGDVQTDGRLVLKSQTMIDKLVFVLRRELQLQPGQVKNMRALKYFENFYTDIDDFKRGDGYILSSSLSTSTDQAIVVDEFVDPQKDSFYIDLGNGLYSARRTDDPDYDANIYAYNSESDVRFLESRRASARTQLMCRYDDVVTAFDLVRVK